MKLVEKEAVEQSGKAVTELELAKEIRRILVETTVSLIAATRQSISIRQMKELQAHSWETYNRDPQVQAVINYQYQAIIELLKDKKLI